MLSDINLWSHLTSSTESDAFELQYGALMRSHVQKDLESGLAPQSEVAVCSVEDVEASFRLL